MNLTKLLSIRPGELDRGRAALTATKTQLTSGLVFTTATVAPVCVCVTKSILNQISTSVHSCQLGERQRDRPAFPLHSRILQIRQLPTHFSSSPFRPVLLILHCFFGLPGYFT